MRIAHLFIMVVVVSFLVAGCTTKAEYTVLAKNMYRAGDGGGKFGYYVTLQLMGAERETLVDMFCFNAATLGQVLPAAVYTIPPSGGQLTSCR